MGDHSHNGSPSTLDPRFGTRALDPFANHTTNATADTDTTIPADTTDTPAANQPTRESANTAADTAADPPVGPAVDDDTRVYATEPVTDTDAPVVDAELVDDRRPASKTAGKAVVLRRAGTAARRGTVQVVSATRKVVTHPATTTTTKAVGRNLWYLVAGAGVAIKRWRDAHGASRYERMMRAAELSGNREMLLEWEARDVAEKQRRHERVMDWVRSPIELVKAALIGIVGFAGLLLGLGVILAIGRSELDMVLAPILGVIEAICFAAWFVTVYGGTMLLAITGGVIAWLWHIGRSQDTSTPRWLRSQSQRSEEVGAMVTADGVVNALMHLPIGDLKKAFKQGWTPRFELTPTREGHGAFRGYRTIFDLPMGVTPRMVADAREVFAKNLHRNAVEVWPSDYGMEKGGKPGYVNLYVADSGVMDKPTPEYPLLTDGVADVFKGVPIGITQRGETVLMPIAGSNAVFGGQPGQGKSNAVRVAVAGAALDPLAEIRMHVFALNGDFDAYKPRLSLYEKGATDEHVTLATEHLERLLDEVGRREGRLAELNAKKLTRSISQKHPDMRPLLVGFSECHELFSNPKHGSRAAELAIAVVKRGRKTGISLIFDTQSARASAIPPQLVENVGFNGCFSVKTWRTNDGFLGDGSFAAGIRATDLRFNVDKGTMVATGASEELFEIVRTFFIEVDDDAGWDQATDIINRAMAQLDPDTPADGARPLAVPADTHRDLLDDLDEVLPDTDRIPAGDVIGALRNLAPDWKPYAEFTVPTFVAALAELGIKVPSTGNKYPLDPVTVRDARARRKADGGAE